MHDGTPVYVQNHVSVVVVHTAILISLLISLHGYNIDFINYYSWVLIVARLSARHRQQ